VLIGSKGSEISGSSATSLSFGGGPGLLSDGVLPFDLASSGAGSSGFKLGFSRVSDVAALKPIAAMSGAAGPESDAIVPKFAPEDFWEIAQALSESMEGITETNNKAFFIAYRGIVECLDGIVHIKPAPPVKGAQRADGLVSKRTVALRSAIVGERAIPSGWRSIATHAAKPPGGSFVPDSLTKSKIVNAIDSEHVVFVPGQNLANYVEARPGSKLFRGTVTVIRDYHPPREEESRRARSKLSRRSTLKGQRWAELTLELGGDEVAPEFWLLLPRWGRAPYEA